MLSPHQHQDHTRSSPSSSRLHQSASSNRYQPYMTQPRKCRYPDGSVSPSPPPAMADVHFGIAPTHKQTDYLSALPQELIEEIGLLACVASSDDDLSEPFHLDRHRQRSLHALSLVSKQFHQIFSHRLYLEPLVIDTQGAQSLSLPNSAPLWVNPQSCLKAPLARRFTLWRPWSEEMIKGDLYPVNPFIILQFVTNIRELTLSGNFRNIQGKGRLSWIAEPITPNLPHLSSVRLIEVDDAELINLFLAGVAQNINTLVIHPASTGVGGPDMYNPRSVYTTLRLTIEKLTSLESLTVSLPSVKINHCNHGHKLLQKTLACLPSKEKLKHFTMTLPLFDCRSAQWLDASDSEDEQDVRTIDHAWFWMTLQNFLSGLTNLTTFTFTGSMAPDEIRRKIIANSPNTTVSFVKAELGRCCRHIRYDYLAVPLDMEAILGPPDVVVPQGEPTAVEFDWEPAAVATSFHFLRPSPDPYPQPLPVEPGTADAWSHIPTYEGLSAPFSDGSHLPLSIPSLLTSGYNPADTSTATEFEIEPAPASPRWQEPPLSQDYSVDSGFASQQNTVDSGFASQNAMRESETTWPPPSVQIWPPPLDTAWPPSTETAWPPSTETTWPPLTETAWLPPLNETWDWYIKYD